MGAVADYLVSRVQDLNTNADVTFVGSRGCGKSYGALRLGEVVSSRLNTPFTIEGNVFFDAGGLLKRIDELTRGKSVDEVQAGYVLVLDEAGLAVNSQEWWDTTIQALSTEMEVFRCYRFVLIMTTPAVSNISKRIRNMTTCLLKPILPRVPERRDLIRPVSNINFSSKKSCWRFYILWCDPAPTKSSSTTAMPMYRPRGKESGTLDEVWFNLPSKELLKDYEAQKRKYLDERRTDKIKKITGNEKTKKEETTQIVDRVCRAIDKYKTLYHDKWIVDAHLIHTDFNISMDRAKGIKKAVERRINV